MKKIAVLLTICLCCILSCNQPIKTAATKGANTMENEQTLLEKENKSLVQEKNHTSKDAHWTVKLTGELKDTRTIEEQLADVPRKEDIVNTVTYISGQQYSETLPFYPEFEIRKVIKHGNQDINFTLTLKVTALKTILFQTEQQVHIRLAQTNILPLNCKTSYKNFDISEMDFLHSIICITDVPLDKINELRQQQSDFSVVVQNDGRTFAFPIPQKFIEFLRNI